MLNYQVPFYRNTSDGTHCFQAVFKMILKYFLPQDEYSFEDQEKITAKVEGLWTWSMAGLVWLHNKGFDVKKIQAFSYKKFSEEGELYLFNFYTNEVAKAQIEHSDIPQEIKLAKKFAEVIEQEVRIPTVQEIPKFLDLGYLVGCNVNSRVLNNKPGYSGHFVVVKGYEDGMLILHDPGPP